MTAGYVGFAVSLPPVLHLVVALAAGLVAGAGWGWIAGYLKARTGANEIITTIMLNYIAISLLRYLLTTSGIIASPGAQASKVVDSTAQLPRIAGSDLPVNLGLVIAVAAAIAVGVVFTRTRVGFRLRAVGANPAAALTAGMSVRRLTVVGLSASGALAGLAGAVLVLGGVTSYQVTPGIDSGVGFTAITVALLGRLRPAGIVLSGVLLGALTAGGSYMQSATSVPADIVTVIQALIIAFIAAPKLVTAVFRVRPKLSVARLTTPLGGFAGAERAARPPRIARRIAAGGMMIIIGVLIGLVLTLSTRTTAAAPIGLSVTDSSSVWSAPTRTVIVVLAALTVLAGVLRILRKAPPALCSSLAVFAIVAAFILWSVAGTPNGINLVSLLQGSLFPAAVPLIFGALAGVVGERGGVVNVAIEGQLLLGAFCAAVGSSLLTSAWGGVIGGIVGGVFIAACLGLLAVKYLVDHVIAGVTLNLLAAGLTGFLFLSALATNPESLNSPVAFPTLDIPVLSGIPLLGPVLFQGSIMLYIAFAAVAFIAYSLFRTRWGLRVRAAGEHPAALDTVGVNVSRVKWQALLVGGVLAGLGGAFLIVGTGAPATFQIGVSAGKGFIALAAVIFGRWNPIGALAAALLFGFFDQLQSLLAQAGAPVDSNLLLALPYIATLFAVAGFVGRAHPPAAVGQPYHHSA